MPIGETEGGTAPSGVTGGAARLSQMAPSGRPARLRRVAPLHPVAWWLWAAALAAAAARCTNPVLLGLILVSAGFVTVSRRGETPWARSFGALLRIGVVVIAIRVAVQMMFGLRVPGTTLFDLPSLGLPSWMAGVSVGGPVTADALVSAGCQGLRLAVILACVGAANSLASPSRLLRCVPAGLYEIAVAVTVAVSFTPAVVASVGEVRDARRLRGRPTTGLRGMRSIAVPVLEGALEHSIGLAASMDARGFGRRNSSSGRQRATSVATLAGLVGLGVGAYGVLDSGSPTALGLPALVIGFALVLGGLVASSSGARSRYRPDRFSLAEWVVTASGVAALSSIIVVGHIDGTALGQPSFPLALPSTPIVALLGVLVATVPAFVAPAPIREEEG